MFFIIITGVIPVWWAAQVDVTGNVPPMRLRILCKPNTYEPQRRTCGYAVGFDLLLGAQVRK